MLDRRRFLKGLPGIPALLAGCGQVQDGRAPLRVAAASDLQGAWPVLASAFRRASGVEAEATFGASGQLAEQVRQGAPFDLFLSADRKFVERLAGEGAVDPSSIRPYARGVLVLALRDTDRREVAGLADLAGPSIRFVAIANPETAPYGRAAKQALERAGLFEAVSPKLVPAGSVHLALQLVRAGEADVGIVGRSTADAPGVRSVALPPDASDPIVQCLGVVARSSRKADASALVDFLLSDDGQKLLSRLGFEGAPR